MSGPDERLYLRRNLYAVISDSKATRFGITRVDPLCVMRCCFLKPANSRLTVSREEPIICPISSWVKASFTWLGFLAVVFWSSHPTSRRASFSLAESERMRSRISRQVLGVIFADVLGHPQGNLAVSAHQAQQIAVPQEADFGRFLGLGCRFIGASGNHRRNSQGATGVDHTQNQRSAVAAANRKLDPASTHDEHSARSLGFGEQHRSRGIGGGKCRLLQSIGHSWGKIAKSSVYCRKFLGGYLRHVWPFLLPPLTRTLASASPFFMREPKFYGNCLSGTKS